MTRLKTRIDRLEASAATPGTATLSPAARTMLVSCYGRLHAWYFPSRSHRESWAPIRSLRREYIAGRIGISARAAGREEWKSAHTVRTELATAGLAESVRGTVEVQGLRLTPLGRAIAWSFVGDIVPGIGLAQIMVEKLATLEPDRVRGSEKWVSESKLFGFDCHGDASTWIDFTDSMLEPAIDGAIDSLGDTQGRIFYRHICDFEPLPEAPAAEYVPELSKLYVESFKNELGRLRALQAEDGEITIPL